LFQKRKLRKEYDQKLIDLIETTKNDWLQLVRLDNLSYDQNVELDTMTRVAKAKYFYLFQEAKRRKVSVKR